MQVSVIHELLLLFKDFVLSSAAVVGAYVAFRGLSTWRRQLQGGFEYELARRLLKNVYRVRDAVHAVRNPFMPASEMPPPPESESFLYTAEMRRYYGVAEAYQRRWSKVDEAWIELKADLLEAEAVWGAEVHEKVKPFEALQRELAHQIRTYLRSIDPRDSSETRLSLEGQLRKQRDIMYSSSESEKDVFSEDVKVAIRRIESFVKPHLRR